MEQKGSWERVEEYNKECKKNNKLVNHFRKWQTDQNGVGGRMHPLKVGRSAVK